MPAPALAFWRRSEGQTRCVGFNLSDQAVDLPMSEADGLAPLQIPGFETSGERVEGGLRLAARGVFFGAA